jgi:hypothetical protein
MPEKIKRFQELPFPLITWMAQHIANYRNLLLATHSPKYTIFESGFLCWHKEIREEAVSNDAGSAAGLLRSLRAVNGLLVTNITGDVFGHAIAEINNYTRLRISGEISPETPCMLFTEPDKIIKSILEMFPGMFEIASVELIHKRFSDHIVNCHPELIIDVGLSSSKASPPARGYVCAEPLENMDFYRTSFINGVYSDMIKYFKRIKATPDAHPICMEGPLPANVT